MSDQHNYQGGDHQSSEGLGYGQPLDLTTKKKNPLAKVVVLLGALAAMGIVVGGMMNFFGGGNDVKKTPKEVLDNTAGGKNFQNDKDEILEGMREIPPAASEIAIGGDDEEDTVDTETAEASAEASAPGEPPEDLIRKRKLEGEIMKAAAETENTEQTGMSEQQHAAEAAPESVYGSGDIPPSSLMPADNGGTEGSNVLGNRLKSGVYNPSRAAAQGITDYQLARGTAIPCVLTTKIVTTFPGLTRCQVTRDVYSANGKTLLIERGSTIIGEQTSALMQGQARVFAQWSDLRTPGGAVVKLDSLGADPLGASGHPARVNYHFWRRFGGAILISMIGDLGNYAANRKNGNGDGQTFNFESTSQSAQDMATEALKNSINIPPTGYVNQGTQITVFVARDVDFSDVYETIQLQPPRRRLPIHTRIRQ